MAEALAVLGVIAAIAQLADLGCKLSVKLFVFSQTAATADESVKGISTDVSLTSTVLQELSNIIKSDESRVVSPTAIEATRQTVAECLKIFKELDETLEKTIGNDGDKIKVKGKKGMRTFDKLKFPFKQPKIDLLRSNLDRLKASLSLMLQVLSYARDVASRKAAESSLAYQHDLIEALARSQSLAEKKYRSLQRALENRNVPPPLFNAFLSTSVQVPPSRELEGQSTPETTTTPTAGPSQSLAYEVLVCFDLLNEVQSVRLGEEVCVNNEVPGYTELQKAIEKVKEEEQKRIDSESPTFFDHQNQAVKNLLPKLKELSKGYHTSQNYAIINIRNTALSEQIFDDADPTCMTLPEVFSHHESPSSINNSTLPAAYSQYESPWSINPSDGRPTTKHRYVEIYNSKTSRPHRHTAAVNFLQPRLPQTGESTAEIDKTVSVVGTFIKQTDQPNWARKSPWSMAYESISSVGAMTGHGIANLGNGAYKAVKSGGSWLVTSGNGDGDGYGDGEVDREEYPESPPASPSRWGAVNIGNDVQEILQSSEASISSFDSREEEVERDVVGNLLTRWTNLPA